jgi:hypothetical protein
LPKPHEDVQEKRVQLRSERMRGGEQPSGQALGGTEGG